MHCLVKHSGSYNDVMLANAGAGGGNAGRAGMIDAWLGERLNASTNVAACIEKLLAAPFDHSLAR